MQPEPQMQLVTSEKLLLHFSVFNIFPALASCCKGIEKDKKVQAPDTKVGKHWSVGLGQGERHFEAS